MFHKVSLTNELIDDDCIPTGLIDPFAEIMSAFAEVMTAANDTEATAPDGQQPLDGERCGRQSETEQEEVHRAH